MQAVTLTLIPSIYKSLYLSVCFLRQITSFTGFTKYLWKITGNNQFLIKRIIIPLYRKRHINDLLHTLSRRAYRLIRVTKPLNKTRKTKTIIMLFLLNGAYCNSLKMLRFSTLNTDLISLLMWDNQFYYMRGNDNQDSDEIKMEVTS